MLEDDLIPFLKEMLAELETNKLKVELVPNQNNDGMIRVATSQNPKWYQKLCSMYPAPLSQQGTKFHGKPVKVKPRTKVKRAHIINVLNWMIKHGKSQSTYAEYLLDTAIEKYEHYTKDPDEVDWQSEIYG